MSLAMCSPGAAFPLLLPCDATLRAWEGFLGVTDSSGLEHQLWVRVSGVAGVQDTAPPAQALADAVLTPGEPLRALLLAVLPLLGARLRASPSLPHFLCELREAARAALDAAACDVASAPARPVSSYAALAAELGSLPAGALGGASSDLSRVTLRLVDQGGREHLLQVSLPPDYPARPPSAVAHSFPSELPLPGAGGGGEGGGGLDHAHVGGPQLHGPSHLAALLRRATAAAALHAPLWAALEVLDARCYVVDPPPPVPLSARYRRLSLGGSSTLWLELPQLNDGDVGAQPPALRVSGPEPVAAPLRASLAAALTAWTPRSHASRRDGTWLRDWLLDACGSHALPHPPGKGGDAELADADPACAICYAFLYPGAQDASVTGATPECCCDNARCGRAFHAACLAEWLRADAGAGGANRATFGRLFGECPYCRTQIAVQALEG